MSAEIKSFDQVRKVRSKELFERLGVTWSTVQYLTENHNFPRNIRYGGGLTVAGSNYSSAVVS